MAFHHHSYKMFMCFNRKFKITEAQPPLEVIETFSVFTNKGNYMNVNEFRQFLIEFQKEDRAATTDAVAAHLMELILQRRRHLSKFTKQALTLDDFFFFLFCNDLNGPINNQVHHDMTAPLQHYFIYTGHNSYLTGNQLSSDCSDVPIIKALQRGVRVIELDIWPNSAKNDINVLHGRTLTTPVPLIKCLKSIREHAFCATPYPLIITLEDHLTPGLQAKVAKMLTEIFGEMLYTPDSDHLAEFPSPEELKYRIIISTKPPKEYLEAKVPKDSTKEDTSAGSSGDETQPNEIEIPVDSDEDEDIDTKSGQLAAPEYKRLIAIRAGKPKDGLRVALRGGLEKVRRLSLSEQALEKATSNYGVDVVRFTQRNFLRIYPKGTRIRSSNYKPLVGWMHGAQMVAFNMQGYGKSLWVMHGMFRSNGGCGYVKKPEFLLKRGSNHEVFNPEAPLEVKKTLKVRVYMGDGWRLDFKKTHFDTFSPPDFYVKFRLIGAPGDYSKKKTKVIEDDWVPIWDQEFEFPLTVPELALLQIEVREYDMSEKDDFGGQTCLPVSEIKSGIRSIQLCDKRGQKLPSARLLIKFQFV